MSNITIEDYKRAIRAKYKIATAEDVSGILSNPKPAEIRNFYFRIFEKGVGKIDKEIMEIFFETRESFPLKRAIENCNTGKLKPIISFLQGGNTENGPRIEMAAILVDFKPRPFRNFEDNKGISEENKTIEDLNGSEQFILEVEKAEEVEEVEKGEDQNGKQVLSKDNLVNTVPSGKSIRERFNNKVKLTIAGISIVFCLGFLISYYLYPKKQCMQWTGDHYEKVDCVQEVKSLVGFNSIKSFEEQQFELKKIEVCDTTTYLKNGQPIIWYGKINSKVDFFNIDGWNPINGKQLRPVTDHIFNKYKEDCQSKNRKK